LGVQHALLLGSIIVLALTGMPQRLDTFGPSEWIMDITGGIETLRTAHHVAGAVLIGVALYHVATVFVAVLAGRMTAPLTMIPDARDVREALASVRYLAGRDEKRPSLRDPGYFEKVDYWVIAWGVAAMGMTGVARLFPATSTDLLSGEVVAAALEFHSDVAILVVVWIAVVHVTHAALSGRRAASSANGAAAGVEHG
jgi:hypothetical protein